MLRVREVAVALNFTERTVRQWIAEGKISAVKIMSEWRVPASEVARLKKGWLDDGSQSTD